MGHCDITLFVFPSNVMYFLVIILILETNVILYAILQKL